MTDKVIVTDQSGKIIELSDISIHDISTVQKIKGIITPGFINTHCHLELSHMKGVADTGTGLLPFLKKVVGFRDVQQEVIDDAIQKADQEMYENGIVAVGDISNKTDTAFVKSASKMDYYTFVEMFDFMQSSLTESTIQNYQSVYEGQSTERNNKKSYVPHAPYTVSSELFTFIRDNNKPGSTISIHNQETPAENELFVSGTGAFQEFYKGFGFDLNHFKPSGKSAIHYAIKNLNPDFKTLFVHNTESVLEDIKAANTWSDNVYWATCANANLYIENRLPDYSIFLQTGARMTIGTDSLTSNWQLSVWEEIKTIKKYCSYVSLDDLIIWACSNGAKALSFEGRLGTLETGKSPGLVGIECRINNGVPDISNSFARRLA
ncbi:MAG: amidohydrolase family protein [Saprospiraceae bacterium]|nr:amidohydrolase family protein [Saprospiraceae bacterium]